MARNRNRFGTYADITPASQLTVEQEIARNYDGNATGRSLPLRASKSEMQKGLGSYQYMGTGHYGKNYYSDGGDLPRVAKRSEQNASWIKRANDRDVTHGTRLKGLRRAFGLNAG